MKKNQNQPIIDVPASSSPHRCPRCMTGVAVKSSGSQIAACSTCGQRYRFKGDDNGTL